MAATERQGCNFTRWFPLAGTKGGGALAKNATCQAEKLAWETNGDSAAAQVGEAQWHVLWTRSNCEDLVHDQLRAKGFDLFLPKVDRWFKQGNLRRLSRVPLFPGYLFLRHAMDKSNYVEVCKARGLVRILGERWDRLAVVPDREVESIRKVVQADLPAVSYPYLREGQRVRILHGPLADVEGILVKTEPKRGLLVLSVDLLRRSVAVQVGCTLIAPI